MFEFQFGGNSAAEKTITKNSITKPLTKVVVPDESPIIFNGETITFANNKTVLIRRSFHDIKFCMAENDETIEVQDVTKGVYEGGLKTWECSFDLVNFLSKPEIKENVAGKSVIELGCGSSLPGLYCLSIDCKVDFQDYNDLVLKYVTIPNVAANRQLNLNEVSAETSIIEAEIDLGLVSSSHCNFYAGDWSMISDVINKKYDVILSSETIYDADNITSLVKLMKEIVAPNGCAFIAAKKNYFGCTGGIEEFQRVCTDESCHTEIVFVHDETVRREILKVSF